MGRGSQPDRPTPSVKQSEEDRLLALSAFAVLDTPPEQAFDDLTWLAAQLCEKPMALVSLVDADRQWFKSRRGLDLESTPREQSFCAYALRSPEVLEIPDTLLDPRFVSNPLVTGHPHLRFYAGAPLVTATSWERCACSTPRPVDSVRCSGTSFRFLPPRWSASWRCAGRHESSRRRCGRGWSCT